MRPSVLFIAIVALFLIQFGTQVFGSTGSTGGTDQCNSLINQSCLEASNTSEVKSETESETTQTPLLLPDLSPTREDLNDGQTGENGKTSDSNDNDDATTSTSTDSDDGDITENNADDNSDDEQESGDSSEEEDDGKDSGDGPSMIPFP